MTDATEMTGGCACGRVRFIARIGNDDAYLCHCRMCQRATGSISIAFKNVAVADVAWDSEPDWYDSSPIARRPYCRQCGTSLGFAFRDASDKMDLTVAAFDDPSRFKPKHHFGAESLHRAWLNTEGLPEYRTDDYQPLVDRWVKAAGKMPD
ncbi:MAG TPA: GFA family protein [Sphingomicrobium sp.]|nr:GFA family protein [Sphingomicrobium sp.]